MPVSQLDPQGDEAYTLIEEFHLYTKEWAHRLTQIDSAGTQPSLPPHVVHELRSLINGASPDRDTPQDRIQRFLASQLHKGLTLKDLSDFLGYSEKYCSEFFRHQMGQSFSAYLKHMRIRKAQFLLTNTVTTMADIAEGLGFRDQFAFSHFFKKAIGMSPREYRNQHLKGDSKPGTISDPL